MFNTNEKISRDEMALKNRKIASLAKTAQGRKALAAGATEYYQSEPMATDAATMLLKLKPVATPEEAIYYSDFEGTEFETFTLSENGDAKIVTHRTRKIVVPIQTYQAIHLIPELEAMNSAVDLLGRLNFKINNSIIRKNNKEVIQVLRTAGTNNQFLPTLTPNVADFGIETIIDAKARVADQEMTPTNLLINAKTFAALKKAGNDFFSNEYKDMLQKTGTLPTIDGLNVIQSKEVPENEVYVLADASEIGQIFEVGGLRVMDHEDKEKRLVGFNAVLYRAPILGNKRGVQKIDLLP